MARPTDVKYTKTHEWVRADGDLVTVGITDHAVDQLGDLAFIDLPEIGQSLEAGDAFGEIESTKTVSNLYSPVAGEVEDVNSELKENLQTITSSPFESGWMVKIRARDTAPLDDLLSASDYETYLAEEEH